MINFSNSISGQYLVVVRDSNLNPISVKQFTNLITDIGLERIATAPAITHIFVGTSANAVAVSDQSMGVYLGGAAIDYTGTLPDQPEVDPDPAPVAPNYVSQKSVGVRFLAGAITGTIRELGAGWHDDTNATLQAGHKLFSHAKVLNSSNVEDPITVGVSDIVDIIFTLKVTPSLADINSVLQVNGTDYACKARAANLTINRIGALNQFMLPVSKVNSSDAPLGAITAAPTPAGMATTNCASVTYVANSKQSQAIVKFAESAGNAPGGIKSIHAENFTNSIMKPQTQIEFTPPIPKTSGNSFQFTATYTWNRV